MNALHDCVVLVTPRSFGVHDSSLRSQLENAVGEVRYNTAGRALRADELRELMGDVDGLIAGLDQVDRSVFEAAPRLRVVARYGVGTSNVDLRAADQHRVVVTNTPGANATAVAELTLGLMLALARSIPQADSGVRSGAWAAPGGIQLAGRTVGLLGLGRIGRAVACATAGLGCQVIAHDPFVGPEEVDQLNVRLLDLDDLLARADIVSLHVPLTSETRGMIDRAALERMKRGAYLINTARGELVVDADLIWALNSGRIAGAALDTLSEEPPPPDHPLLGRTNVLVTPHMGAQTAEATTVMGRTAMLDLLAVLRGDSPRFPVSPESEANGV